MSTYRGLKDLRKFRPPLLDAGDLNVVITAEGATHTEIEGKQFYDFRVVAKTNDKLETKVGL